MVRQINIGVSLFFCCFFIVHGLFAQQSMIKGFVKDKESGEPLDLVNIKILDSAYGTASDDKGFFYIIGVPEGSYILEAYRLGYEKTTREVIIEEGKTLMIGISLEEASYSLEEVSISATQSKSRTQIRVSEIEVLPADISRLPSIGSLPDIAQYLQTVPGVISSGDAGGQLYIRGGSPVQNKIIMDGAILYNPFHSSGLFSVFDPDAIRKTDVFTGGFGAEYGGSLSSVIDVTTRYGNISKYSGKVDLSTIGSKLLLEGPVSRPKPEGKSNSSFLAYYKTSYFDKAAQSYYSYVDRDLPFSFQDLYGKFSFFSKEVFKANVYGFSFNDHSGSESSAFDYSWKNQGFGSNFHIAPPHSSTLIHIFFAVSGYRMQLNESSYVPRESSVNSVNLGIRINNYFGNHYLKYGIEVLTLKTEYYYYSTNYNQTEQLNNSSELSGFLSFFGNYNKLLINPGVRVVLYSALNKISFEPRISMKYLISERVRLKVAGGLYTQNLIDAASDRDIVNYFSGYLSAPVNIASTKSIRNIDYLLQTAWHAVLGTEIELGKKLLFNLEGYYKDYPQLINYNRDKLLNEFDYPDKPEILTKDFILETGSSMGLETTINYNSQRLTFNLIYSLSKTTRTYENPQGETVTYRPHYDRRHNFNFIGNVFLSKDKTWEFNFRWNLGSGFPFTPAKGYYESNTFDELQIENPMIQNGNMEIYYGTYNGSQLPTYHRLDISILKTIKLKSNYKIEVEVNAINVYNQKNIYYVDRANNTIVYQLPFLPGLRLGFTF